MVMSLNRLEAGMVIPYGGDRYTTVDEQLSAAFVPGDRLVVVQDTGALLHIPSADFEAAASAVRGAYDAFQAMALVSAEQIDVFYTSFADRLAEETTFSVIADANAKDVADAAARGRSTTRLVLDERMRSDMIDGLRGWAKTPDLRDRVVETVEHNGWRVELLRAGLGVVGFVFEGRPNVFADATGVLRNGNTVVFRIGSDALGTARAMVTAALDPALQTAELPPGAVSLVETPNRAGGWAMFSDKRLSLAVARGSGTAVAQLGAVARQAGIAVSLHGTGGAWIVTGRSADEDDLQRAVHRSLDRKVCNTLNTCCVIRERAAELVPSVLAGLGDAAKERGVDPKLWVVGDAIDHVPPSWLEKGNISRAAGNVAEPITEPLTSEDLGREWEWEGSPEITLVLVEDVDEATTLFGRHSPRFIASLIANDADEHRNFYATIDAPFVGNGFTRWVDGQYALDRPELGLSNWQSGRLFGRAGVLSGESVYTIRARATQSDPDLKR